MIRKFIFGALLILAILLVIATAAGATWGFIALICLDTVHLFWRICGMLLILICTPFILSAEALLASAFYEEATFND